MAIALLFLSRLFAPSEPPQGTRISEARRTLKHWSHRESELPWRRRAERREARIMIANARAELVGAHLERFGLGSLEPSLTPLLDTRGRSGGAHARSLAVTSIRRTALGRRIVLGAAGLAAMSVTLLVVAAAIAAHTLGL